MPRPESRTKPAALAAVSLFALASAGSAAIVCNAGAVPVGVPETTAGLYLNLVTGTATPTPGASPGWDINPWGSTALTFWFNNSGDPSSAGATVTATVIDAHDSGVSISAANSYSPETPSGPPMANWQVASTGKFLGLRFWNEAAAAINYGWIQMNTGPNTGRPASVQSYCYQNDGSAITTGTTPVELQTFSVE